ncbi:MAG TPA: hypothetical protein VN152_13440 [Sphingopyxis sp.]|jgi:hypothetical protein|nr:hypothetical protein [Sphingopyxis sp.]HWT43645.1 hypothetical protein [Sphingopyxis sp.]
MANRINFLHRNGISGVSALNGVRVEGRDFAAMTSSANFYE